MSARERNGLRPVSTAQTAPREGYAGVAGILAAHFLLNVTPGNFNRSPVASANG
jgi:hypothetical protein